MVGAVGVKVEVEVVDLVGNEETAEHGQIGKTA